MDLKSGVGPPHSKGGVGLRDDLVDGSGFKGGAEAPQSMWGEDAGSVRLELRLFEVEGVVEEAG